jgi:hypothetical protein
MGKPDQHSYAVAIQKDAIPLPWHILFIKIENIP